MDLAVLRDQREVFGPVASTPPAWRPLADVDEGVVGGRFRCLLGWAYGRSWPARVWDAMRCTERHSPPSPEAGRAGR